MKSEYYRNPADTLEKYEIPEVAAEYAMIVCREWKSLFTAMYFF